MYAETVVVVGLAVWGPETVRKLYGCRGLFGFIVKLIPIFHSFRKEWIFTDNIFFSWTSHGNRLLIIWTVSSNVWIFRWHVNTYVVARSDVITYSACVWFTETNQSDKRPTAQRGPEGWSTQCRHEPYRRANLIITLIRRNQLNTCVISNRI